MKKLKVSYSQFSMWNQCPWRWKLNYIDKIKGDEPSIHLIFGSAMHYVLQLYLTAFFSNGPQYANRLDLNDILREEMGKEYKKHLNKYVKEGLKIINEVEDKSIKVVVDGEKLILQDNIELVAKYNAQAVLENYVSKKDMMEFYYDGVKINEWFKKHRADFFNYKTEELVAIEYRLNNELKENLDFIGFIDVLVRNKETGKIRIIDFKTSTKGWASYKKNDENTTSQLVIYKNFYAKRLNIDIKKIDVEFIILKRKLYEDIPYPQKRITKFVPASGKPTINKVMMKFEAFVESCFDEQGSYKLEEFYPKIVTASNCRYCEFADKPEYCDKKN
jgi:hypothetical protein